MKVDDKNQNSAAAGRRVFSGQTTKYIEDFYDRRAFFVKEYHTDSIKKILGLVRGMDAESVLDIGCGGGEITKIIADAVGAKTVVGVDISRKQLARASKKGIKTFRVDLNREKIPVNEKFDLIICSEVLEHIIDPDHVLAEIYRLSKPKAKQIFSTPNLAAWYNRISLLLGWQPFHLDTSFRFKGANPLFRHKEPYGHMRIFTKNSMIELLARHGLNVIAFETAVLGHDSALRTAIERTLPLKGLKSIMIFLTERN